MLLRLVFPHPFIPTTSSSRMDLVLEQHVATMLDVERMLYSEWN
jgi:hypothetical protein